MLPALFLVVLGLLFVTITRRANKASLTSAYAEQKFFFPESCWSAHLCKYFFQKTSTLSQRYPL